LERLAELVARSGRASADAKRAAKKAGDEVEQIRADHAALTARVAALEAGRLSSVLGAVRGLSTPAQTLLALGFALLALALSGAIFPGIPQAISAIGAIHGQPNPAPAVAEPTAP
jgi:hypothetical protein